MINQRGPFGKILSESSLTLGELEFLARSWLSRLFAFLHSGVSSEMSRLLQKRSQFAIELQQCSGDTERQCASLTAVTATMDFSFHVELVLRFDSREWEKRGPREVLVGKEFVSRFVIDADLAAAFDQTNASDCSLATSGSEVNAIGFCHFLEGLSKIKGILPLALELGEDALPLRKL